MPAPKDPKKRKQWLLNVAKGMTRYLTRVRKSRADFPQKGRKCPPNEVKKRTESIRQAYIKNPKLREKLSRIAKENGYGKWMKGKKAPGVSKANKERKGKSYKELYGKRWREETKKRRDSNRKRWIGKHKKQRNKHNGEARYKRWRSSVFKRDNWTCQKCTTQGGTLNSHHIKSWAKFPKLRYTVANGITLCEECHKNEHQ